MLFQKEDSHLNAMLTLLNITSPLIPLHFGAALILELRQDANGLFYIQLRLRNDSINDPILLKTLKMDNCDELCPLGNFLSDFDLFKEIFFSSHRFIFFIYLS